MSLTIFKMLRANILSASDWTQLPDSPLIEAKKLEWAVYHQALRDMPAQEGFDAENPQWPVKP